VRLGVCTLVAVACAVALGGSADSARTQGGAAWSLKPVAPGQKWLRVDVEGDTLYGFRLRGTSFTVTGIKSVHASGGPTPQCSVSGTPATLACDGDLPGGISVFVQLNVSGSGGSFDFAFLFQPGDTNLLYIPSNETAAPVPLTGTLGKTSAEGGRVLIQNPNATESFQQFEVKPIGLAFTSVSTPDCALTEGGGIACQGDLRPGRTLVIRFGMDPNADAPPAVLLAHGNATGLAYVEPGEPCADIKAVIARLKGEAAVVRTHLAAIERVATARPLARPLRLRLQSLTKQINAQVNRSGNCAAGEARKAASAAACDARWNRLERAKGTIAGLTAVLPTERRVAAKVKALRSLPGRTSKELAAAKANLTQQTKNLLACAAALATD
jgi:hypothetical protein